jgi:hypothetical protein
MAGFEDGPNLHSEGLAAGIALIKAGTARLALERPRLAHNAAMRAKAAVRPNMSLNPSVSRFFVLKVFL